MYMYMYSTAETSKYLRQICVTNFCDKFVWRMSATPAHSLVVQIEKILWFGVSSTNLTNMVYLGTKTRIQEDSSAVYV